MTESAAFRPMKRTKQALSDREARAVLQSANYGVLALNGDNGYTYSVPVSFVLAGDTLYFHGAPHGHKFDSVLRTPKASIAVVAHNEIVAEKLGNNFLSVIAFGRLRPVTEKEEKLRALRAFTDFQSPGEPENEPEIQRFLDYVSVTALTIEHLTGKHALQEIVDFAAAKHGRPKTESR